MFVDKVLDTVNKFDMIHNYDNILIALSGGADSTALTIFLSEIRQKYSLDLHAVYINHLLRPDEIKEEIAHCKRLCQNLKVSFNEATIDVKEFCSQHKLSIQEGARQLRYELLSEKSQILGCNKIAVAHSLDDQAETVLMRLIRGTGVSGLSGILPVRGKIIRPFIEVSRREIEDYILLNANRIGLDSNKPFIVESSNLKTDYLRNKIRLFIMPEIKKINSNFLSVIVRTTDIIRDEERYFEILVTKALMRMISRKGEGFIELFCQPLESMDRPVLRRLLRRAVDEVKDLRGISFINIEDIIDLIKKRKSGDRIYIDKRIRVIKGYSTLMITSLMPLRLKEQVIASEGQYVIQEASMVIEITVCERNELHDHDNTSKDTVMINGDKVDFPLTIRARRAGDYFYPLGFGKKKKIQDFFVDEKIPRDERDVVPLLTSGNDILLIVGHRLDDRYKVDKDTKKVIKCQVKPLKK